MSCIPELFFNFQQGSQCDGVISRMFCYFSLVLLAIFIAAQKGLVGML